MLDASMKELHMAKKDDDGFIPADRALACLEADGADSHTLSLLRTILTTFPQARLHHRPLASPSEATSPSRPGA